MSRGRLVVGCHGPRLPTRAPARNPSLLGDLGSLLAEAWHEPPRSRAEPTRSDAYEPVARWENEGGACDERERTWPTEQMATGEHHE